VIGIITDRDIAMVLALGAGTPDSTVKEAMSQDVETIPDSMGMFDVSRFFRTVDVKRLPVVDAQGMMVGIVSIDDVMALLAREMYDTCSSLEPKLGHMV
jgi:predicted transcriptional regulator